MSWIALTSADVDDYLVSAKADALRTAALRSGQTDTIARIIADVVQYVRLAVASCRTNVLDTDTTKIPSSLKTQALDVVIQRLHLRLEVHLSDDRSKAYDQAERVLNLVRKCDQRIDETPTPEGSPSAQQSGSVEIASSSTRLATGSSLDGL